MNKQQLAAKIWKSANNMRSKIDANEYKDYILGFIFYKYLSEQEENIFFDENGEDSDIKELTEEDEDYKKYFQGRIGYYISYDNLFSTWLSKGNQFDVSNVVDALNAFNRSISEDYKKVFEKIFDTLQSGLNKLGDNSGAQTKAIRNLIYLIKDVPMDDKQGYDVLGFIYEYLISNFAASAGKKAGEFYTPHEVSILMSEIVASHLKDRNKIDIYDPTSGSGSLLINIGKSVSKYMKDKNYIKYYAQELKENTWSLTRMNLVMRGILPSNIITRNGDTLAEDWPYFDDNDKENTYHALYVDAVVSNPPYSQKWDANDMENDARFIRYGLAPKSKADYAFLLHDLYHLKPDGIMTIVLPHGVLFRGGEEEKIRKNLVEFNNIDTIIGLPSNIFFGTSIPTIIMVLRKDRKNEDVLIIDASKGFAKEGKSNKLRNRDVKKIVDTYLNRETIEGFSKKVSRDEIRSNDYNLNIPRYVDSSEKSETWDIYSTMFGGIPNQEIDQLNNYWEAFPNLRSELFSKVNEHTSELIVDDLNKTIFANASVLDYKEYFTKSFEGFDIFLKDELINNLENIDINKEISVITEEIFNRLENIDLVDKYSAYQIFSDEWNIISTDLEIIETEGFESIKQVDPNTVLKKKDGKEVEVQEGYIGHIIPFEIVQKAKLNDLLIQIADLNNKLQNEIQFREELFNQIGDDDKSSVCIDEENNLFVKKEVNKEAKALKKAKISLENFDEIIIKVNDSFEREKKLNKDLKNAENDLQERTKKTIETLTDEECLVFLNTKWIKPICESINKLPDFAIADLILKVKHLNEKYVETLISLDNDINLTEKSFSLMIDELDAEKFDKNGLEELKKMLEGDLDGTK